MADLVKKISDDDFNKSISKGIVLVDFYAEWCGACQTLAPVIEEFAQEVADKITVAKLDTEKSEKTTAKYEVTSIPTLILFKDGKELRRITGLQDMDAIHRLISGTPQKKPSEESTTGPCGPCGG